jgi:tetratricopeptide (TPR) repeat protein
MPGRRALLISLGLALATGIFYSSIWNNHFVNYDDDIYITDRIEIEQGLSPESIRWAFTSTQGANWFPLTRLSWLLDAEAFGVRPRAYHGSSVLLHVANSLLLLWALVRLTGAFWPSAFTASVFALHPLHVESVAWASARKDVLAGLFFMLALLAHERVARSGRPWLFGALLFVSMAFGLMAKSMLVTLPCVLLLLDAWPLARLAREDGSLDPRRLLRALLEKLPLFVLSATASVVTLVTQQQGGALQGTTSYPLWLRLANFCEAIARYLAQAFWPRDLAVFYPHPLASVELWKVGVGAWLLVGVSWWALRRIRKWPWVAVGWLWFVGMLVPVSGILQVGAASRADRYTYLPLIGLTIAFSWTVREVLERWPSARVGVQRVAVVLLLLLGLFTADQVDTWRNSTTLFEHALAATERNHVAHINLGLALDRAGKSTEAESHLSQAVAIAPASALARGIRGGVRLSLARFADAEPDFRAALRIEPRSSRWSQDLAFALVELGRAQEAAEVLALARAANPDAVDVQAMLGLSWMKIGRRREGLEELRRALQREELLLSELGRKGTASVHAQVAVGFADVGDHETALRQVERAIELDPGKGEYRASYGLLLQTLGRNGEAVDAYRLALERRSRSVRVLNNLAWLLASSEGSAARNRGEAVALAREATRLTDNKDPSVLDTLAMAYQAIGQGGQALKAARAALDLAREQQRPELAASILERFPSLSDGREAGPGGVGAGA